MAETCQSVFWSKLWNSHARGDIRPQRPFETFMLLRGLARGTAAPGARWNSRVGFPRGRHTEPHPEMPDPGARSEWVHGLCGLFHARQCKLSTFMVKAESGETCGAACPQLCRLVMPSLPFCHLPGSCEPPRVCAARPTLRLTHHVNRIMKMDFQPDESYGGECAA